MNSWLGGGLSSLKGQLSHLITEGTEETTDSSVEIDIAKKRISELENEIKSAQTEIKDLKERNNDLCMKLQSEELLLQNVSESYQEKLKQKEDIIESLTNQMARVEHQFEGGNMEEMEELRRQVCELNQQVFKWRALAENSQTDSFEMTLNKLLEDQKRELELESSNIMLELQREHSKQIGFLNRELRRYRQSVSDGDFSNSSLPDCTDNAEKVHTEKIFHDISIQTCSTSQSLSLNNTHSQLSVVASEDQIDNLLNMVSDKIIKREATLELILERIKDCENIAEVKNSEMLMLSPGILDDRIQDSIDGGLDNQTSFKYSTPFKNAIADSVSQVSDISEVSIKSKLLEEHVRNLSNQIKKYENQFTDFEDSPNSGGISENVDKINTKIQKLKVNLSQRKRLLESRNLLECPDEEYNSNVVDSWENSSNNSLIEEQNIELQEPLVETLIKELYNKLFPNGSSNKDINVIEMLQTAINSISEIIEMEDLKVKIERQLINIYADLNCPNDLDEPIDIFLLLDLLQGNVKMMKETCSVHDDIIEESKSLQECISQLHSKMSSLENEKCELMTKNTELDEKLMDMSITIARYEGLEKICDTYQKQMATMYRQTDKTNLSMDSDDILEHVETFNQEKDECIQSLESKIVSFQNLCEEKDDYIADLKQREVSIIYEYDSIIEVLKSELDSVRSNLEKNHDNEVEHKKQLSELNELIVSKEDMIKSLNEELTMLSVIDIDSDSISGVKKEFEDEFSQTQNDEEKQFFMDMEHQMTYLITENQRLEKVCEAQAESLGQYEVKLNCLEAENSKLSKSINLDNNSISAEDMTKETLHHLSQMIRDKEWEIEALKSKNESLCSIIKSYNNDNSESPNINSIESLLNEKESLSKEISWYQENRDQLISALNIKHKESLNYHGEIQRLISYINTEQGKWNDVVLENRRLNEEIKVLLTEKSSIIFEDANMTKKPVKELVDVGVSFSNETSATQEAIVSSDSYLYKQIKEQCLQLESENQQKASEIRSFQKQVEHISFELEQSQLQITELTNSFNQTQQQLEFCQNELTNQYRNIDSTRTVDSTKDIWNTEYERNTDNENNTEPESKEPLHQQLCQKQIECENYLTQIEQLKAREQKLLKEKQILQNHLIKVEESYTQDATISEDREQVLRKKLHLTEDNLQIASDEITKLQQIISNARNEFQEELNIIKIERDEAKSRLKETERQLSEHMKSVTNLQMVLDNFQFEQSSEMTYQKERFQQELCKVTEDRDRLERQNIKLQKNLDDQRELVDAAQRLSDQIEYKDDQLAKIQALLAKKEEQIDNLKMEIRKLNTFTESKVDKLLMKNLVIGYFHTPQHRRQEALKIIGSLLQFSDTDYNQIGIDTANKSRWFSWLRPASGDKTPINQDSELSGKSFSELFINFLEKESTPMPQMKLPTNQIATAARQHSSLSQSEEYPYTHSTSTSTIIDHHKFFSSSPVITKRNDIQNSDSKQESDNPESRSAPLLFIPNIREINPTTTQRESKENTVSNNHRRSESNRNALLSLLDQ